MLFIDYASQLWLVLILQVAAYPHPTAALLASIRTYVDDHVISKITRAQGLGLGEKGRTIKIFCDVGLCIMNLIPCPLPQQPCRDSVHDVDTEKVFSPQTKKPI